MGAQEGSAGLAPSALCPPEPKDEVTTSASPGCHAGRGFYTPPGLWHIGKCRGRQTEMQTCKHGEP